MHLQIAWLATTVLHTHPSMPWAAVSEDPQYDGCGNLSGHGWHWFAYSTLEVEVGCHWLAYSTSELEVGWHWLAYSTSEVEVGDIG